MMENTKTLNIAFEISPFLTASGTFGDKSGVYRYMYGLLYSMNQLIKKGDIQCKIYLFSFNSDILRFPINPEIYQLIDNKDIYFIDTPEETAPKNTFKLRILKKLLNLKPNILIKLLNQALSIKEILEHFNDKFKFESYLQYLDGEFNKYRIDVIVHSETGFYSVGPNFKNTIIMYDFTPLLFEGFHRKETKDLKKRKLRFAEAACDGIISISASTQNDLLKYFPAFKSKKNIISYPGLQEVFAKNQSKSSESFGKLNLILKNYKSNVKRKKYLLYYGTFEPRKNIGYIVEAFSDLQKKGEIPADFKLILCGGEGWGKTKKGIENYIKENSPIQKENNITVMSFLSDEYLVQLIKNAYAVIYPSLYEGFGLPVLESMALGTPVICSNTSSLPEVGGSAVLYINPKNYLEIRQQIKNLISKPLLATSLSKKGLLQSKKFTWEHTALDLFNFLKKL